MWKHFTSCFFAGLIAILPVGGLILVLYKMDETIDPLLKSVPFDFPGRGIIAAVILIYLLGLMVTTVVGRWLWSGVDRLLERLPGLAILYQTLKQILGYGAGKDALFQKVVLIRDSGTGAMEMGLVTEEVSIEGQPPHWSVFLPGSPNPALGRMVLIQPQHCVPTQIPVDVAIKALLSTGKTGLSSPLFVMGVGETPIPLATMDSIGE